MEAHGTPVAHIRKKYQITIPKKIREELNLEKGDYVLFWKDHDDRVIMSKAKVIVVEDI